MLFTRYVAVGNRFNAEHDLRLFCKLFLNLECPVEIYEENLSLMTKLVPTPLLQRSLKKFMTIVILRCMFSLDNQVFLKRYFEFILDYYNSQINGGHSSCLS